MREDNLDIWIGFVLWTLGVATACFIVMSITQCAVDESWRKQIADHGCAGFYLDANSNRQWDWKKDGSQNH